MKYRVEIDVAFDDEHDAVDLLNYIENIKSKAYKPKGTEKIICFQKSRYHLCTHDDETPVSCKEYVDIEFEKPKKTHVKKEAVQ